MGTRDYARKCGFKSAVLGLSGGIDSSIVACIAAEALGAGNVLGVSMPSMYSAHESFEDARSLAQNLGMQLRDHSDQTDVPAIIRGISVRSFAGLPEDETEENLQARIRGTILMALSNKFGHWCSAPGTNRNWPPDIARSMGTWSEDWRLFPMCPKTMIYKLAAYINRQREIIPRNTIERPPSAELRPNQTDQDTLPEYDILDGILKARVEEQMSVDEIVAQGYERQTVQKGVRHDSGQ